MPGYAVAPAPRSFSEDNYDTLVKKAVQLGSKLLKKPDQCRAVVMCSHLFWADRPAGTGGAPESQSVRQQDPLPPPMRPLFAPPAPRISPMILRARRLPVASFRSQLRLPHTTPPPHMSTKRNYRVRRPPSICGTWRCPGLNVSFRLNIPVQARDGARVLECLKKAIEIADHCVPPAVHTPLFIEILNEYLFYYAKNVEEVRAKLSPLPPPPNPLRAALCSGTREHIHSTPAHLASVALEGIIILRACPTRPPPLQISKPLRSSSAVFHHFTRWLAA